LQLALNANANEKGLGGEALRRTTGTPGREILIAGYAGGPLYHRSDVHLVRPDGTGLTLKELGWDGDEPRLGRFSTTLTAHTVVGGAGYWWRVGGAAAAP
jgi:hypothetical protein